MVKNKPVKDKAGLESERTEYNVPPEKFVVVWESSSSAEEAADRLGMPKAIASARASGYRKLGVPLKHMPRTQKKSLPVEFLKSIISETQKQLHDKPAQRIGNSATDVQRLVQETMDKLSSSKK